MKMIIGGQAQGKRSAACRLFNINANDIIDGAVCKPEETFSCKAICNFHILIRRMMECKENNGEEECAKNAENFGRRMLLENPQIILITNEIGCGLVPVDAFERAWRDVTGRICCGLAEQAESVVRVTAGLVQVIK